MKDEKDTLLPQILEKSRESIVYFQKADGSLPFQVDPDYAKKPIYNKTGTGFFVESDKVLTTIDVIAGGIEVSASLSNQFETEGVITPDDFVRQMKNKYNRSPDRRTPPKINEDAILTIEGVTAFDPKNNLVLLKVAETGTPLQLGNSDSVLLDELVYILAHFEDIGAMGVAGKVAGKFRNKTWLQIKILFFAEACGGPVLNTDNEVVGVTAFGVDFLQADQSVTHSIVITSNLIRSLLSNSEEVIPLERWQKYSRVRAHVIESEADELAEQHDNMAALQKYNDALKLNPDIVSIYTKRGRIKTRLGNMAGALRDFNKAVEYNPNDSITYNNRASVKSALGDIHGMLDDLNKALQMNPNYILGHLNRGQAKCMIAEFEIEDEGIDASQRLYKEAIDDFTKVLQLDPKHPFARKRLRYVKRILKKLT